MLPEPEPSSQSVPEQRFDDSLLRKVVTLATQLQARHEETLTAGQVEAIGEKLGIERPFIQQALARINALHPRPMEKDPKARQFQAALLSLLLPLVWGTAAFASRSSEAALLFFSVIGLLPAAGFLGFLTGKKDIACLASSATVLALAPATFPFCFIHVPVALPLVNWLSRSGAELRQEHFPTEPSPGPTISRMELLHQLFDLQSQLDNQKAWRTFLSVDIVGSSQMTRSAPELAVEYSFGRFREWVEQVVIGQGGRVQSAAGDGVMCLFTDDAAAIRAALQIQRDLPAFNAEHNRLPTPFQVRCGVSAGEVPIEEGVSLRDVQSPAIYRAAMMQKRAEPGDIVVSPEVAGAAMLELRCLAPLPESAEDVSAFSWRAGQRTLQSG